MKLKKLNHAKTLILRIKFGQQQKIKEFTLDYHIKDPNQGFCPRTRITDIKWIRLNENTNWLFKKIIDKVIDVNGRNFDLQLKFLEIYNFQNILKKERILFQALRLWDKKNLLKIL